MRWMGKRVSFDSFIKKTALRGRETAALFRLQTRDIHPCVCIVKFKVGMGYLEKHKPLMFLVVTVHSVHEDYDIAAFIDAFHSMLLGSSGGYYVGLMSLLFAL